MRRAAAALTLGMVMLWLTPAAAGEPEDAPLISKCYRLDVAPAQTAAFEQALRAHRSGHATNADPWAWYTWQVVNGAHDGSYVIRSHGHRWRDFDQRAVIERLDRADFSTTVAPHVREVSSWLERLEPALSTWTRDTGRPALVEVTTFEIAPDHRRDFYLALGKIHRAVAAKGAGMTYAWSVVVNGSEGPTMVLAVPHASWAELASPASSPWPAVAHEYGADEGEALRSRFEGAVRHQESCILVLREDLSYEPK